MNPIPVTRSSMPPLSDYINEIAELWNSRWLTNMGVKHRQLEAELKTYFHVPNITLYANGHLALENILEAMEFPKGAEIITTPFTFASTTHAIVRSGLTPVFCDINDADYTIDVNQIEGLITEKTAAILPVHVYGNICDAAKIQSIADKHTLKVIYDAAHAFGVTHNGENVANFGDASMFSFHATKVFNTIEGGAVTYRDSNFKPKLNYLKNFGISSEDEVDHIGGNAKMNEFTAAMGICNLRYIDEEIAKRKAVAERYIERLADMKGIGLSVPPQNVESNYAYFPVLFDGYKYDRNDIYSKLKAQSIYTRKYFYPLANSFACYAGQPGFNSDETPVAKHIAGNILALPMYADLDLKDVNRICDIILD